jgi:DUF917 family protein
MPSRGEVIGHTKYVHEELIDRLKRFLWGAVTLLIVKKNQKAMPNPDSCFDVGMVTLSGTGPANKPCTIKIYIVNENIAIRVDGKLKMGPTMFCYITKEGQPFTNAELIKNWPKWQDATVTLTQIAPPKQIAGPEEEKHFLDLYHKYFGKRP